MFGLIVEAKDWKGKLPFQLIKITFEVNEAEVNLLQFINPN